MYSSVNEGVLGAIKGVADLFRYARGEQEKKSNSSTYNYSSVARAASKLIAVFPLLTSRSISASTAQLVAKYIEQKECIFLQLVLQSYNITDAEHGIEFLKNFHQNLNIGGAGLDAMAKAMDAYLLQIVNDSAIVNEEASFEISARDLQELMEMLNDSQRYDIYDINLNPVSINDYTVSESMGKYTVSVKPYVNEATSKSSGKISNVEVRLDSQDVKKLNNGVPSLLMVRFYSSTAKETTKFIIGVKSLVVPVNSAEILRRIVNDNKDGKHLVNLLRTISGEIRIRDLVLGISTINDDINSMKTPGTQTEIWQMLRNRSIAAKESMKSGKGNIAAAITTVVLSQDDCDELFREENIDITNPKIAKHFMDTYNLMGIVICNDALESMKCLMDDGNIMFEEMSYSVLSRETEDQYKKIISLIDKAH